MERVSVIEGTVPAIIVAPHGPDDFMTAVLTETIALDLSAYAVINQGWEKAEQVNCFKDKANCNNLTHCHEDVVKDEFLLPIMRYVVRILKWSNYVYLFMIHGLGDEIKKQFPDLQVILGCGKGKFDASLSCEDWRKDMFVGFLANKGIKAYEGIGGHYAGKDKNNLNQLYRQWYPNHSVHSMQIEVIRSMRNNKAQAQVTALNIARAMSDLVAMSDKGYSRIIVSP
jgi:hypothetical protein